MAEFARLEARTSADLGPYPSRLMRVLLAVREVALIIWLTVFSVLGILALSFLAEFANALDDATEPAPNPIVTECVGEIC